jgi:hypothetical protein
MSNDDIKYKLTDKFTPPERFFMVIGFYGFIIVGAAGIYSVSILWGLIYTAFAVFGLLGVVLSCLCSHCPYPYEYNTCLFLPVGLVKKLRKYNPDPLKKHEKLGFAAVMAGLVVIPQYWLVQNLTLLILFWGLCIPTFFLALPLYYCKHCRLFSCPFNKVPLKVRTEARSNQH